MKLAATTATLILCILIVLSPGYAAEWQTLYDGEVKEGDVLEFEVQNETITVEINSINRKKIVIYTRTKDRVDKGTFSPGGYVQSSLDIILSNGSKIRYHQKFSGINISESRGYLAAHIIYEIRNIEDILEEGYDSFYEYTVMEGGGTQEVTVLEIGPDFVKIDIKGYGIHKLGVGESYIYNSTDLESGGGGAFRAIANIKIIYNGMTIKAGKKAAKILFLEGIIWVPRDDMEEGFLDRIKNPLRDIDLRSELEEIRGTIFIVLSAIILAVIILLIKIINQKKQPLLTLPYQTIDESSLKVVYEIRPNIRYQAKTHLITFLIIAGILVVLFLFTGGGRYSSGPTGIDIIMEHIFNSPHEYGHSAELTHIFLSLAVLLISTLVAIGFFVIISSTKFQVTNQGIIIRRLIGISKFFSWESIEDVNIDKRVLVIKKENFDYDFHNDSIVSSIVEVHGRVPNQIEIGIQREDFFIAVKKEFENWTRHREFVGHRNRKRRL